ncbi:MAG: hypothetical protein ACMUEM_02470 [Flavobacteriales bacterium AspAUS03]
MNLFKKIHVVYLSQEYPEWWSVKNLINWSKALHQVISQGIARTVKAL